MKYFLLFLGIWMATQFIFRLVIPLFMTGRQLRKGFRQMQEQMQEQMRAQQGSAGQPPYGSAQQSGQNSSETRSAGRSFEKTASPKGDDYLDFEEVKESGN